MDAAVITHRSPLKEMNDYSTNSTFNSSPQKRPKKTATTTDSSSKSCGDKSTVVLRFAKLSEHATTPKKGSSLAAGYDLYR